VKNSPSESSSRKDRKEVERYKMEPNKESASPDQLKGRSLRLADLVGYQKGAVVSRTLIDERKGTVTLFAFDGGQRLSEHTAPFDAVVNVIEGEAEITISGEAMRLSENGAHRLCRWAMSKL